MKVVKAPYAGPCDWGAYPQVFGNNMAGEAVKAGSGVRMHGVHVYQ